MRVGFGVGGMLLSLALAGCGASKADQDEALTARGQYLVEAVGGCHDCHTPMTAQGPDMSKKLQGATLGFAPTVPMPAWAAQSPPVAGLGPFSEEHVVSVLTTGARPDGTRPRPPMPPYRMTAEDAKAVAHYLATLPKA